MRVSYSEHPPLPRPSAAPTTFYYIISTLPQAGEGFLRTNQDSSSELQWSVPTARSDRAYNWGDSAIAPDAVGHLLTGGLHIPFYFEHELRARHPRGVIARLRPYESYYWSPEHKDDQPPFPTTLFVVDTDEVEDTYVRTATQLSRMSLPILVSSIPVLSTTGMLGRAWRPLWDPESPRLPLSELSAYQWDSLYHRMRHRPAAQQRVVDSGFLGRGGHPIQKPTIGQARIGTMVWSGFGGVQRNRIDKQQPRRQYEGRSYS